jgi:hypothetical protein
MKTNWLSITGKVNIPVPLVIDTDYTFMGNISVYGENVGSKQDGSYNVTYKAKFTDEIFLQKGEKAIQAKDKSSNSQKWRRLIQGDGFDYDRWMQWQFRNYEEMKREYETTL